jgi:hypothetical protein
LALALKYGEGVMAADRQAQWMAYFTQNPGAWHAAVAESHRLGIDLNQYATVDDLLRAHPQIHRAMEVWATPQPEPQEEEKGPTGEEIEQWMKDQKEMDPVMGHILERLIQGMGGLRQTQMDYQRAAQVMSKAYELADEYPFIDAGELSRRAIEQGVSPDKLLTVAAEQYPREFEQYYQEKTVADWRQRNNASTYRSGIGFDRKDRDRPGFGLKGASKEKAGVEYMMQKAGIDPNKNFEHDYSSRPVRHGQQQTERPYRGAPINTQSGVDATPTKQPAEK